MFFQTLRLLFASPNLAVNLLVQTLREETIMKHFLYFILLFSEHKSVAFNADETQRKNIKRGIKVYAISQNLNLRKAINKIVGGSILLISGISYAIVNTSLNVLKVVAADRNLEQERSTENNQSPKTDIASVFGE